MMAMIALKFVKKDLLVTITAISVGVNQVLLE